MNYVDPSGHGRESTDCGPDGIFCDNSVPDEEKYGIFFTGETAQWNDSRKDAVITAVKLIAFKLLGAMGGNAAYAWSQVYGFINFEWQTNCAECRTEAAITRCGSNFSGDCAASGGFTVSRTHIKFASMSGEVAGQPYRMVKNVVHELGHAYDHHLNLGPRLDMPAVIYYNRDRILRPNDPAGRYDWQQHPDSTYPSEVFADMFIAWTYNIWNTNPDYALDVTNAQIWISGWMP